MPSEKKITQKAAIAPYEAVGVVAAQSLGEPGTQMSIPYSERVIIKENNDVKIVRIGEFIDSMIKRFGCVKHDGHEICNLANEVYAPSLNCDEKIEWGRITSVSRHRSPEKLIRITLSSGRQITATPFHSFVIRKNNKIIPVATADLPAGERLPVLRNLTIHSSKPGVNVESTLENFYSKKVPAFTYSADDAFVSSLLRGYFDNNGNVTIQRNAICFSSVSKELIDGISILLLRFGIFSTKGRKKNGYTLSISYRYAEKFLGMIGSEVQAKIDALKILAANGSKNGYNLTDVIPGPGNLLMDAARRLGFPMHIVNNFTKKQKIGRSTLVKYLNIFDAIASEKDIALTELEPLRKAVESDVVWDRIVSIEYIVPDDAFVYDFTVPGTETFTTFDGVITHNTMRTFHYAGVAEHVPTGLPRLIEIVDSKKEPKKAITDIHIKPSYAKSQVEIEKIAIDLSSVTVSDVASLMDNLGERIIKIKFNEKEGKAIGITFSMLKKALEEYKATSRINDEEKIITIKPKKIKDSEEVTARNVRRITNRIKGILVRGVRGLHRAVVIKGEDGYFIRAAGFNIEGILANEAVDPTKIYTNNIKEIERVFGIEAARNAIVKEIQDVMDMQKLYVDIRHIMLIADAMTFGGQIKPIGRHGLSGEKIGVLGRAAFEETIKHLVNASAAAIEEHLIGVTENIIIGQTVPVGTGRIRLLMKEKKGKKE